MNKSGRDSWDRNREKRNKIYKQKCIDKGPLCCVVCSSKYYRFEEGSSTKTCSTKCRKLNKKHRKKARKRLRNKKSDAFNSPYTPLMVFNRNKWRCNLCGCKVQKKNIYADNAAEIDHVLPLSKGGVDEYWNVQTLCRACNSKKGNSKQGQLSIFHPLEKQIEGLGLAY